MIFIDQVKTKVFWKLLFPVLRPFFNSQKIFSIIYSFRLWGPHLSISGQGSEIANTRYCLRALESIIDRYQINSLIDVPCGDFSWLSELIAKLNIDYTGLDIVKDLIAENCQKYKFENINFKHHDVTKDQLPDADLIFCRDRYFI